MHMFIYVTFLAFVGMWICEPFSRILVSFHWSCLEQKPDCNELSSEGEMRK